MFYNYSDSKFKIQLWVLPSMNIFRVKSSAMWSPATICIHLCTVMTCQLVFCILQLMQWWRIESVLITLELEYWAARFLFIRLHPIMIFSFLKEKEFINKRSPWGAISLGLYRREKIIVREIIKVEQKSLEKSVGWFQSCSEACQKLKKIRLNFSTVTYIITIELRKMVIFRKDSWD